jgi:ubiquinone/menaquinone biosynthesis C-methylase UbiE
MKIKGFQDTIAWYDANAEKYADVSSQNASIDILDEFVSLLPKNASVLDAGCGAGRDTQLLVDKNVHATGLDISTGLLNEAQKRHPLLEFIYGSFLNLPFSDNSFDGIWAHASLVHLETIEDVTKALSEFSRVLKPEGIIHILVKAQTGNEKTGIVSDTLSNHDRFFQYYKKDEMEDLLEKYSFEVKKIEQFNEIEKNPQGRPEVEWIAIFAKKI